MIDVGLLIVAYQLGTTIGTGLLLALAGVGVFGGFWATGKLAGVIE